MKKRAIIILIILILGFLGAYLLLNKNNSSTNNPLTNNSSENPPVNNVSANSYGCEEILNQINACWGNRTPASGNVTNCWEAPLNSTNTCDALADAANYRQYEQCNGLALFYYPPSRLSGYNNSEEGLVMFSCPM